MYVGTCIHVSLRINHKGFYGAYRLLLFVRTRTQVLRTDPQVQASVYLGFNPLAETIIINITDIYTTTVCTDEKNRGFITVSVVVFYIYKQQ